MDGNNAGEHRNVDQREDGADLQNVEADAAIARADTVQGGHSQGTATSAASKKLLKRKSLPVKGDSNKRMKESKNTSPPEHADDGADDAAPAPRAHTMSDSSELSDGVIDSESSEEKSGDEDDSSSDSDEDSPPRRQPTPSGGHSVQGSSYVRFDPGEDSKTVFSLPTDDMVRYASQRFTQFVTDKKTKELILDEFPVPAEVPGVQVPKVDEYSGYFPSLPSRLCEARG